MRGEIRVLMSIKSSARALWGSTIARWTLCSLVAAAAGYTAMLVPALGRAAISEVPVMVGWCWALLETSAGC